MRKRPLFLTLFCAARFRWPVRRPSSGRFLRGKKLNGSGPGALTAPHPVAQRCKSFLVLFFKKEPLLLSVTRALLYCTAADY
jgi:hypothetical protein